MSSSTLGRLTLGYQIVWSRLRQPRAVQLFLADHGAEHADCAHLLRMLEQTWSELSPVLMLAPQSAALLDALLQHAKPDGPCIIVQHDRLADPGAAERVRRAHARGVPLLWRGEPGLRPDAELAACFQRCVITLSAGEALVASHAALRLQRADPSEPAEPAPSPVQADQIYESVASRVLADHCLDQRDAWGLAGWPGDDVLLAHRHQPVQPAQRTVRKLIAATDADAALELIEHALAEEPVLAYRFLVHANSAALGLRTGVDSLRHGLMVLGLTRFKQWLLAQLAHASSEINLDPVRAAMVLRARLMEHLLDPGDEDKLRREVFLCGMLSQLDRLLDEPLAAALQPLPLSERITGAVLGNNGPYAPFLELATALEYPRTGAIAGLCEAHAMDLAEVNRTLLRTLAQLETGGAARLQAR